MNCSRIIYFAVLFLLVQSPVFSQENSMFFPHGYINNFTGYGFSRTVGAASNIGNLNPAALSSFDNFSLGLSYQFDTRIKGAWLADIDYLRNKNGLPQSAGIVIPVSDFRFGLALNQKFNGSLDFGNIPVTTVENPEGTGVFWNPILNYNLISFSVIESWSLKKVFDDDRLSFGVRLDFNKFYLKEESYPFTGYSLNESLSDISASVGITYEKFTNETLNYRGSLYYEKGTEKSKVVRLAYNSAPFELNAKSPDKIHLSGDVSLNNKMLLSGGVSYIYWKNSTGHDDNPEYNFSAIYKHSDMFTFSAGAFYQVYSIKSLESYLDVKNKLKAFYLTVGGIVHINNFDFSLGIADSHLFTSDWRQQTIITSSIDFRI